MTQNNSHNGRSSAATRRELVSGFAALLALLRLREARFLKSGSGAGKTAGHGWLARVTDAWMLLAVLEDGPI